MNNNLDLTINNLGLSKEYAIGNDLVYFPNFALSLNPLFIKKVYTANEIKYCEEFDNTLERYASTWAAKEAVYKCIKQLSKNIKIGPKKIEILRKKTAGEPIVNIPSSLNLAPISLSITHDGDYTWAIAIYKRNNDEKSVF
ncbi:holo-ACP synthase [Pedobacter flavus]|uniref:4'-phosphopantetheinyl transferase superfamily protein n=1 Tax=Pedobacter flavus TaxID=3113906 RepID=A0ABU7H1W4_9SPHI|nr:4'-phosphopantetheinyl transferase superfamily protein [Pedobacter sp. VNH31]MEE1885319.1 4'-phosphopantetheinyl transferase superfamily protein [Pedobacter sp. VNH31]